MSGEQQVGAIRSVVDALEDDHIRIEQTLEGLDRLGVDERTLDRLYRRLRWNLKLHAFAEAESIYQALRSCSWDQEVRGWEQEHREIDALLAELDRLPTRPPSAGSSAWQMAFRRLRTEVRAHLDAERDSLYRRLRECFNAEQLATLDSVYRNAKEQWRSRLPSAA